MKRLLSYLLVIVLCCSAIGFATGCDSTDLSAVNSKIEQLEKDLAEAKATAEAAKAIADEAKARVAILEGIANIPVEETNYEVGVEGKDTFTFVNNGIKLFSVRLDSYGETVGATGLYLTCELINFSMPTTIHVANYLNITAVNVITNKTFSSADGRTYVSEFNIPKRVFFAFPLTNYVNVPAESITHFYLGIPNQSPSISSLIPYAKFKLPTHA